MLSFVGLFAVVMITVTAMNVRKSDPNSARDNTVSPDSLTFEVRREERNLKDGEFLIPGAEDDGIRGQSPRLGSSLDDDRGLFTNRNRERGVTADQDEKLFRKRSGSSHQPLDIDRDVPRAADRGRVTNTPAIDDDETVVKARPARDRRPPAGSPLIEDDWSNDAIAIDGSSSGRRPSATEKPGHRHDTSADSFDDIDQPSGRRPTAGRVQPSSREIDVARFSEDQELRSLGGRTPGSRDDYVPGVRGPVSTPIDEDLDLPIDLRRHRNPSRLSTPDSPPSHPDAAPARIDKRYLDIVKDNTIGIRKDESEVFFWLLDHARRVAPHALERAAEREVQYINVMTEPERFRGEPITIEGDLWRLYEFDAGKNDYGVGKMYEGWVFTGDSSNHPYRIVCTSIPNDMELGENLRTPVRVTGYFFKKEGYRSNGGVHVAPTLLAKRISINPMPNGIPQTAGILPYMIGAIMAVGMALLVTIVGFAIGDSRSSRQGMERLRSQPAISFAGLNVPPAVTVEETLRELSECESPSPVTGAYGPLFSRESSRFVGNPDRETSRFPAAEGGTHTPRYQATALQSWSTRQQAMQAEIDGLRSPNRVNAGASPVDELATETLDAANHVLLKGKTTQPEPPKPISTKPAVAASNPVPAVSVATTPVSAVVTPAATASPATPPASPVKPANPAYGASKIAEWETEIAQLTQRTTESPKSIPSPPATATPSVTRSEQQVPPAREPQGTTPTRNSDKSAASIKPVPSPSAAENEDDEDDEDRVTYDRADRDSKSFSLADTTPEPDEPADYDDTNVEDDLSAEDEKPSRWDRFRRRRKR